MKLESVVVKKVKEFLEVRGCLLACFNSNGYPDRMVIPPKGIPIFFIEFKRHTKGKYKATDGQLSIAAEMIERGHKYLFVYNDSDWETELKEILGEHIPKSKETEMEKEFGF